MAETPIRSPRHVEPQWRRWTIGRGLSLLATIRGRILVAFLAMSLITGALGAYAALTIRHAGLLVAKTFDESLISINYARTAAADFAAMQAASTRRAVTQDAEVAVKLDETIDALGRSLAEDLEIAADRSHSPSAAEAARGAEHAVAVWRQQSHATQQASAPEVSWSALDGNAETVNQQIDLLVNAIAGAGFANRQHALATVATDLKLNLMGTTLAILLSAMVAITLARRIIGPVAAASTVAGRIAAGQLDGTIPRGGADELGALLRAMGAMRDKIAAMMEREVAVRSEARIAFMARHDALTGLPNRVQFGEKIEEALGRLGRDGGFAVLCLNIDRFKPVNDTLGHHVGDELLRAIAERLRRGAGDAATLSRLGGDEFAFLLPKVDRPEAAAIAARQTIEVLSAPYDVAGHRITVGASVGVSLAPGDGATSGALMKNADVALYRAKADGRGTWRFFEAEMDARLQARRTLELDLRDALARDEFEVHYQPLYDLAEDRVSGFEALARWRHPTRGLVMPSEFISLAEEIGLIVPIGERVLRRACAEAVHWPAEIKVGVNVSAIQFKGAGLIETVREALAAAGLPARRLELEITESVLVADNDATLALLHGLRSLGVRIAMDDFGTGYSSLSYLRAFPFDKIKIDQSFVRDLPAGAGPIVRAILTLADALSMRTTAEGVETEEQFNWLREEGCREAQGYYLSRPVPPQEIPALIERLRGVAKAAA
jgi:diguanylate cyclase (GGDEF)-like protein